MKKILLVLMMIFLGHSAFAMYCWEERTPNKNHTSAMTAKLGASNIVKVSTFLTATYARDVSCEPVYSSDYYNLSCTTTAIGHNVSTAEYEAGISHGAPTITNSYSGLYWSSGSNRYYYPSYTVGGFSSYKIFDHVHLGGVYGEGYGYVSTDEHKWNYWYGTYNVSARWYSNDSNNKGNWKSVRYIEYISPYYTHTFCTTVGGGGGAAGAAVNYIIKAD